MNKADDLFAKITNNLIAAIEGGTESWSRPWAVLGQGAVNAEGRSYRGLNVLVLAFEAAERGYTAGVWGTYKQWKKHDCQVRKGEKGTPVVLWKPFVRTDAEGNEKRSLFATTYTVFAAEQVDNSEAIVAKRGRSAEEIDSPERITAAEAYFAALRDAGCAWSEGGDQAYYRRSDDTIHVPTLAQFRSAPDYYTTLAHEAGHWTGHESRLNRTFGARFGDEAYAVEELTAEVTAAFWAGANGVSATPRPDHAQYLAHWVRVLRADPKAIVTAASKAQAALDLLDSLVAGEAAPSVEAAA